MPYKEIHTVLVFLAILLLLFSGVEVTNTTNTLNHVDVRWVDWSCQHFYQDVVCT